MRKPGDAHRLALEPRQGRWIRRHLGGQHLDRDVTVEARIPGAIDLAHSSGAKRCNDLVIPEAGSRIERHVPGILLTRFRATE